MKQNVKTALICILAALIWLWPALAKENKPIETTTIEITVSADVMPNDVIFLKVDPNIFSAGKTTHIIVNKDSATVRRDPFVEKTPLD